MPTTDEMHQLTADMAVMKEQMRAMNENMAEIKNGFVQLSDLREDLAKFAVHHEAFRNETKTMWSKIDAARGDIDSIKSDRDRVRGALGMAAIIWTLVTAVGGTLLGWTWIQVQSVPVLIERVNQLEQRGK